MLEVYVSFEERKTKVCLREIIKLAFNIASIVLLGFILKELSMGIAMDHFMGDSGIKVMEHLNVALVIIAIITYSIGFVIDLYFVSSTTKARHAWVKSNLPKQYDRYLTYIK